ncbi:MAG TPA: CDP-diacylglycerol--serine O-phosphatidyltransferase [Myxococcota bacterium]|jgi:CDP-diacylglycerol--serine O-phosphatidyltransferase|nr:CDP-diacylglycerol--serine O-phosphatidyltransferase [Myxococcota bacterium]
MVLGLRKEARPPRQRGARRRRLRLNLGKALFILPNLFTCASIFCGFYSIIKSLGGRSPLDLHRAAVFIVFGFVFDLADGRIARATRTQSSLGMELDSLADIVSFGVAPAMIAYKWCLQAFGLLGVVVAFAYCACGAIRLARFNVLAWRAGGGGGAYSLGLPIPGAAAMIVGTVMTHDSTGATEVAGKTGILALVLVLSYLMVSNVRFRTFKDLFKSRSSTIIFMVGGAVLGGLPFVLFAGRPEPAFVLLVVVSGWVMTGLVEEIIFFRRRRQEAAAAAASAAIAGASDAPHEAGGGAGAPPVVAAEGAHQPHSEGRAGAGGADPSAGGAGAGVDARGAEEGGARATPNPSPGPSTPTV